MARVLAYHEESIASNMVGTLILAQLAIDKDENATDAVMSVVSAIEFACRTVRAEMKGIHSIDM